MANKTKEMSKIKQVIRFYMDGSSNKEIAELLEIEKGQ